MDETLYSRILRGFEDVQRADQVHFPDAPGLARVALRARGNGGHMNDLLDPVLLNDRLEKNEIGDSPWTKRAFEKNAGGGRRSKISASSPLERSCSATFRPTKPAPPVSRIISCSRGSRRRGSAGRAARRGPRRPA